MNLNMVKTTKKKEWDWQGGIWRKKEKKLANKKKKQAKKYQMGRLLFEVTNLWSIP